MVQPISEASSYLCPNGATYIQASVVMGPLMKALNKVWHSQSFTAENRVTVREGFVLPRVLESAKINPGMTNMQDEINQFVFYAGVTCEDPNLLALAILGSHGLQKKIDLCFSPDGSTEESIAAGYHNVVVRVVSNTVAAVQAANLPIPLDLTRLEKARELQRYLAMPDGMLPNRGDAGAPVRMMKPEQTTDLKSVTFDYFGMTVLRHGTGDNTVYVALDHRPASTTHSHHDKLGIILYGNGHCFGVDDGSLYNIDPGTSNQVDNWAKRGKWGYHSLVHNTVTVDEKNQLIASGHRLYFQDDPDLKAVGAYTTGIASDVGFERHIAVIDNTVVMVDRLLSPRERTYDLAHHAFGTITTDLDMKPVDQLGPDDIYTLPENVLKGQVAPGKRATVTWTLDHAQMQYMVLNVNASPLELHTAVAWANVKYRLVRQEAPMLMVRSRAKKTVFVSVMSFSGEPPGVTCENNNDKICKLKIGTTTIAFDLVDNKVSRSQ